MPKWLDRFKRGRSRPLRRPPRRELAPVEDIVEQGLLVADVAARMSVKNEIIMNALKHKMDYDEQQIIDMVSETVNELAIERERDASHIDLMREEIQSTGHSAWSESDYGSGDNRTLRHRQQVYEGVAVELHRRASDPEYLRTTAERARAAAWAEIGDSLRERAAHPYYAGGSSPEYQRARESRIQLLIERDLTDLMQQRAAEEKASSKKAASKRVAAKKAGADGDAKEPRSKRRLRGSKTERSRPT